MEHTQCPVCASDQIRYKRGFDTPQLMQCARCKFVFCARIPSVAELNEYYHDYGVDHYLSPITVTRYHQWLDYFEQYRVTGNLLDTGCGSGYFLDEAQKRGWQVYGTEYSDNHVNYCRNKGIIMWKGAVDEEMFPGIVFDVITSIEVIEHVTNPRHDVEVIASRLRKGGLFYCTTPNFNALMRFWLGKKHNIIAYPEHLSYFTASTLSKLCGLVDLKKIKIETTGISLTRFAQSQGKRDQAVVSATSDDERLRQKIESGRMLGVAKTFVNGILNMTSTGHSLKGWFVKT
jgi:2-polyprenyl-3-methyl-5-hydroxy-6-metoxy-1,4-benzoquinol methylase